MMRTLAQLAPIAVLAALTSSDAFAGATAPGAICEYVSGDSIQYATTAIEVSGASVVTCAVPVDHQLGTTVTFRVAMTDSMLSDVITCNGYAYSQDGTQLNSVSPNITSSACNGQPIGCKDIEEKTITVSPQSATNVYVVRCQTPVAAGTYSSIESVRAY